MPEIERYNAMPVTPSLPLVLHRLGYHKGASDAGYAERVRAALTALLPFCRPDGLYRELAVLREDAGGVFLEGGVVLPRCDAVDAVCGFHRLAFMASSLQSAPARAQLTPDDLAAEVVLDALLSECADAGLDWIMAYKRRGRSADAAGAAGKPRRISPGYGNLPLSFQKVIYDVLNAGSLGVTLTKNYMLLPEKSVFAVMGVNLR